MVGTENEEWILACEKLGIRILFVFSIGVIPDSFYEYLKNWVEMGDEDEECNKKKGEYTDGYHLENANSDICQECWDDKRKDYKSKNREKGTNINE